MGEDKKKVYLDVSCGRYLDTSLIDVDSQPTWLSILIKQKRLQLLWPCEVICDAGDAKRSKLTGNLLLTLPKLNPEKSHLDFDGNDDEKDSFFLNKPKKKKNE